MILFPKMSDRLRGLDFKLSFMLIGVHVIIAIGVVASPVFAKILGVVPVLLFPYFVLRRDLFRSVVTIVYYAGLELTLRMTGGAIGYEFCKYFVIVASGVVIFVRRGVGGWGFLVVAALLCVSIFAIGSHGERWGKSILFSLSGVLALLAFAALLRDFPVTSRQSMGLLGAIALSVSVSLIVVILKTPDFAEIDFRSASNFDTSGSFGPVHVSTIFGVLICILFFTIALKKPLFINIWGDVAVLSVLVLRILLTFSRSGVVIALLSIISTLALSNTRVLSRFSIKQLAFGLLTLILLFQVIWGIVVDLTGGMASNRFTGKDSAGNQSDSLSTDRTDFVAQEMTIFYENSLFGVGPGQVATVRTEMFGNDATSHTEYTRLLSEHGLFGIVALIVLLFYPFFHYRKTRGFSRVWFVLFCSYSLFSMIPAATRTTLPLVLYGLSLVSIRRR